MFRLIARLDVKPPNLVKGIQLEGVRKLGRPEEFANRYYRDGADELFYQDVVASLYGRNSIKELIKETAQKIFIPIAVGGGIRSLNDIQDLLRHGADKVSINTAAINNPDLIKEAARIFGSQCIVVAIEIMRSGNSSWEPLTMSGRQHSQLDALDWAKRVVDLGAGELFITAIENEGTEKGLQFDFVDILMDKVNVPVILHGGAGNPNDVIEAGKRGLSGVAIASILHYGHFTIEKIKKELKNAGIKIRL